MKLGIVLYSSDPEIIWNAFRLGIFSLKERDQVRIFLLAKGVECENIQSEKFNIKEQMQDYLAKGGEILACGTCLKIRQMSGSGICPVSSMKDLYQMIQESDKLLTF